MTDIYKAAGIIILDNKLLVCRSKGKPSFYAPGGKIYADETPKQSLKRELKEELDIDSSEEDFVPFGTFTAAAMDQPGKTLKMDVFMVDKYAGEPVASSEIEALKWITSVNDDGLMIGSIFEHEVMPKLKEQGLID